MHVKTHFKNVFKKCAIEMYFKNAFQLHFTIHV